MRLFLALVVLALVPAAAFGETLTTGFTATTTLPTAVAPAPLGPPTPASGWRVAYGDAFSLPLGTGIGQDGTWTPSFNNKGCCNNTDEIAVERPNQDLVTGEGLAIKCEHLTTTIEGLAYSCGGARTEGTTGPKLTLGLGQTLAFQYVEKLPPNYGNADPASWMNGPPWGTTECDTPEFYGSGWGNNWERAPSYFACFASPHPNLVKWGATSTKPPANPDQALHTYTTYLYPVTGGYRYRVYVDGVLQKLENEGTGCYSESCAVTESPTISSFPSGEKLALILTYGLRAAAGATGFTGTNQFTVRSVTVYEDGAHAGVGIENGGLAPGTTLAGEPEPGPVSDPDQAEDEAAEAASARAITAAKTSLEAARTALKAAEVAVSEAQAAATATKGT